MAKGTVFLKNEDKDAPVTFLQAAVTDRARCMGFATIMENELNVFTTSGKPDVQSIEDLQKSIKPLAVFHLGDYPDGHLVEDIQPWKMIVDKNDKPVVVGFFEGDFSGVMKTDSAHLDAYHACHDHLIPTLRMLWELCEGDVDKLYKAMNSEAFEKQTMELFTSDGSITLFVSNGDLLRFTTDNHGFDYDWGWSSLKMKTDAPKELTMAEKVAAKLAAAVKPAPIKTNTPAANTSSLLKDKPVLSLPPTLPAGSPTTLKDIMATKEVRYPFVGHTDVKLKRVNDWYKDTCGYIPENLKALFEAGKRGRDLPGVVSKKDNIEAQKEYNAIAAKGLATDVGTATPAQVLAGHFNKDKPVIADTQSQTTKNALNISTLSPDSLKKVDQFVKTWLDRDSSAIAKDPAESEERKRATFLDRLGLKNWYEIVGLPKEAWAELATRHDLACLALVDMAFELRSNLPPFETVTPPKEQSMADRIREKLAKKA